MTRFSALFGKFLLPVSLLAATSAAQAQSAPWKNLGPWGGTVKFLRYSDSGDTLTALTTAGLHRRVGAAGKWETIPTSGAPGGAAEFAIQGDTILMLGSGLSVSKDQGKTWKTLSGIGRFDHMAYRGGTLYLSRDTLVFRSENLGDSIVQAACANLTINTASRKTVIGSMELLGDTLLVSGGDVFMSVDKGEAFATLGTPENPTAIVAMSAYKGEVHVIGNFGKYWVKKIGINSWSLVKTFPSTTYGGFKSIAIGTRKLMIAGIGTYDFSAFPETAMNMTGIAGLDMSSGGMLVLDSAKLLASAYSAGAAIYSTANGGADWKKIDLDGNGVTLFAKTDTALYAASGKYVFRGSLDGQTWKKMDSSLNFPVALGAAPTGLYCFANGMYRSTDGGASWAKSDSGFPHTFIRRFISGSPGFYALSDSGIHRLSDDGASWSYAKPFNNQFAQAGYVSGDTLQVAMRGNDSVRVIRTWDKGATWNQVAAVRTGSNTYISVTAFFGSTVLLGQDTVFGLINDGATTVVNGGPWRFEMDVTGKRLYVRSKEGIYTLDYDAIPTAVRERLWSQAVKGQSLRFLAGGRLAMDFTLASRQAVRLEIYSLAGKLLSRRDLGLWETGSHHAEISHPVPQHQPVLAILKAGDRIVGANR